ncbi:caspase family protein [Sandarakinorhabdus sp.]|uniref:caspase family protein n=1 Tax=Sandarakinorhabdus sp. TaxID=1916663 RepID=UPI003F70F70E
MIATVYIMFSAGDLAAAPPFQRKSSEVHAVVIGIDAYKTIGALQGAVNDAELISSRLRMLGGKVILLTNQAATRAAVLAAISDQGAAAAASGGTLVVTYAGHGWQEPEHVPGDERDGKDEAWLLAQFSRKGPGSVERLLDNDLNAAFRAVPTTVPILFVSDSCHSGTMTRAVDQRASTLGSRFTSYGPIEDDRLPEPEPATAGQELDSLPNMIFAGASQEDQQTPELMIEGTAHGALSWQFARALTGQADLDGDGRTTLAEFRAFMVSGARQISEGRQIPVVDFLAGRSGEALPLPVGRSQPAQAVSADNRVKVWILAATEKSPPVLPQTVVHATSQNQADLVIDLSQDEVLGVATGDVLAQRRPDQSWTGLIAGAADKVRALALLRALAERQPMMVDLLPRGAGALYSAGTVVELLMSQRSAPAHLTLFNIAGDGTVQWLFPNNRAGDSGIWPMDRSPTISARVTAPFGTDHVVVVATTQPPIALRDRVRALQGRQAAMELAIALPDLLPGGANQVGLVALVTGDRDVNQ